jgi:hypothetical protein
VNVMQQLLLLQSVVVAVVAGLLVPQGQAPQAQVARAWGTVRAVMCTSACRASSRFPRRDSIRTSSATRGQASSGVKTVSRQAKRRTRVSRQRRSWPSWTTCAARQHVLTRQALPATDSKLHRPRVQQKQSLSLDSSPW